MTAQVSPRFLPHPVVPWGPGAVLELLRLLTTPDPSYVVNLGDTPRTFNQFCTVARNAFVVMKRRSGSSANRWNPYLA